jgi:hypothetical protein
MATEQPIPPEVFAWLEKTAAMGEEWHINQALWLAWQDGNKALQRGWREYVWAEVLAMETRWPGAKDKFLSRMKALRAQHEPAASHPAMATKGAEPERQPALDGQA